MEDRVIALTPWLFAWLFKMVLLFGIIVSFFHLNASSILGIAVGSSTLVRTFSYVMRKTQEAWQTPF